MVRVEPVCKRISAVTEVTQEHFKRSQERIQDNSSKGKINHVLHDTAMRFTHVPFRQFPAGASPTEITKLSMDKSKLLEDIGGNLLGLY